MSTKIYNAYKFYGTVDVLLPVLRRIKPKWHELMTRTILAEFALDDLADNPMPLSQVRAYLTRRVKEESRKCFPTQSDCYDIRGSAVVYFLEGKIYVQFFTPGLPVEEIVRDVRLKDYHYQDQTDPWYDLVDMPEEDRQLAEADYAERQRVWSEIFENSCSPVGSGFVYEFVNCDDYYTIVNAVCKDIELQRAKGKGDTNVEG